MNNSPRPSGDSNTYSNSLRDAAFAGSLSLPPGWIVFEAEDGSMVYYNAVSKETRWSPPEGTTAGPASASINGGHMTPSTDNHPSPISATGSLGRPRSGSILSAKQVANEGVGS
jgi:hypothetical protein